MRPRQGPVSRGSQGSVALSLLLGALLVPLTAVAAVLLVEGREKPETTAQAQPAPVSTPTVSEDLIEACGPAGVELVDAEAAASATPLQRAALDALRPICDTVGMPLPVSRIEPTVTTEPTPPVPGGVTVEAPIVEDTDGESEYEYEDKEWEIDD